MLHKKMCKVTARRERDKHDGGLIEFVKNGFISKNLNEYGTKQSDSICSVFTIRYKQEINMLRYLKTFKPKRNEMFI